MKMKNKFLISLLLLSKMILSQTSLPIGGTGNGNPLSGPVECRYGVSGKTALFDTVDVLYFIGAGNRKDLRAATIYSRIGFSKLGILNEGASNGVSNTIFKQDGVNMILYGSSGTFKGLRDSIDPSSNYSFLSHTNKGYVDTHLGGIAIPTPTTGVLTYTSGSYQWLSSSGGGGSGTVTTSTVNQLARYTGTTTVAGNSSLTFNPNSGYFSSGGSSQWIGQSGVQPIASFRKDTNGCIGLTVENQSNTPLARAYLAVVGTPTAAPANNANYLAMFVTSKTYTNLPVWKNTGTIQFGGDLDSATIYSDSPGGLNITSSKSGGGLNFPASIFVAPAVNSTGNVGIGTNAPQQALHVIGKIQSSGVANGTFNTLPYNDINGVWQPNSNLLWITGTNTLRTNGTFQAPNIAQSTSSIPAMDNNGFLIANPNLLYSQTTIGNPIVEVSQAQNAFTYSSIYNSTNGTGSASALIAQCGSTYGRLIQLSATNTTFPYLSGGSTVLINGGSGNMDYVTTGTNGHNFFVDNNTGTPFNALSISQTGAISSVSNYSFTTSGATLSIKSGTNQRAGKATMSGGTITVANTTITANSLVIVTPIGSATGYLSISTTAGTGFTITSSLITDTRVVNYLIIENP